MKLGAFHFANKPFNVDEVAASVARALETTRLRREVKQLRGERTAALHPARHCRRVPGDGGVAVLENAHACTVAVADREAGFGGQDPEQLFEASHTTKKSGTGLGLAIVRRLVSLQGGTVALIPRDGGWAVARITLPSVHVSGGG